MAARKVRRHWPGDVEVAPGREAFSAILDDFFDRADWWSAQQAPWPRLSLHVTQSRPNVQRWLVGSMPKRENLYHLQNLILVDIDVLDYALNENALPSPDDLGALSSRSRSMLCTIVGRLREPFVSELVPVAQRLLELQELQQQR